MSHYDIDYSHIKDKIVKRYEGLKDIDRWSTKIIPVMFDAAASGMSYKRYSFYMSFAGVQGYPCAALWDYVKECCTDMTQ